ncbi:MAG: helix-turn-helix domain-containing protein, partial [Verrucomicrobiae bacterium]|nr:helix-turn-helix domain-containing protein [Verrucomicrobiae bacterium]
MLFLIVKTITTPPHAGSESEEISEKTEPIYLTIDGGRSLSGNGVSRSTIYEGIRNGWFKSIIIKKPGNVSGRRLIHRQSFVEWLESMPE